MFFTLNSGVGFISGLVVFMSASLAMAASPVNPVTEEFDRAYTAVFPHYLEYCYSSPSKRLGVDSYQSYGHSFVYVHGACLDPDSLPFPALKRCSEIKSDFPIFLSEGAAVGVNGMTRSAKFVIVNDKNRVFDGVDPLGLSGATEPDVVTWKRLLELASSPHQTAFYTGVDYFNRWKKSDNGWFDWTSSHFESKASDTATQASFLGIGTDYAVSFVRHSYCVRFPLEEKQLDQVIDYTVQEHAPYRKGKTYHWKETDTCTHFTKNLLAATGWVNRVSTGRALFPLGWMSLVNPFADFMSLLNVSTRQLPDWAEIDQSPRLQRMLEEKGELPFPVAPILTYYPMKASGNEVFEPVKSSLAYSVAPSMAFSWMFQEMDQTPRFKELAVLFSWEKFEANRVDLRGQYKRLLERTEKEEAYWFALDSNPFVEKSEPSYDFSDLYGKYKSWLKRGLENAK